MGRNAILIAMNKITLRDTGDALVSGCAIPAEDCKHVWPEAEVTRACGVHINNDGPTEWMRAALMAWQLALTATRTGSWRHTRVLDITSISVKIPE